MCVHVFDVNAKDDDEDDDGVHVCRFIKYEECGHIQKKNAHSGKPDLKLLSFLTPAVLFIIPTIPLFSSSPPVCFLSSYIDLAMSPYLYLLYIFSHLFLHAHRQACTHAHTRTRASEMRTSLGAGSGSQ